MYMSKTTIDNTTKVLLGAGFGFFFFLLTSHPQSKLKKSIPEKKYKKISILPNIQYQHKNYIYHFHHWLVLSICYIPLMKSKKIRQSHILHGLFLGSILQGLLYKDRFHFKYSHATPIIKKSMELSPATFVSTVN